MQCDLRARTLKLICIRKKTEFVEWKWVKLKNITELVIPFKKAVYESIVEQFFWIVDSDVNR